MHCHFLFRCCSGKGPALTSALIMLHQRQIKPFRGGWMLTAVVLWPYRDLRPAPRLRLPNLPVYAAVSAARAVYHPLLSVMGRCCWLSGAHRGGELFSHSKGPFAVTLAGITKPKFPTELFHQAAARFRDLPPSEKKWRTVCFSECLAGGGPSVRQWPVFLLAAAEQKGKAEGQNFWGSLVEMCVRLLLDRGRLQSPPPPSGLPNTILHCYQNMSRGPPTVHTIG